MMDVISPARMISSSYRLALQVAVGGVDRRAEEQVAAGLHKAVLRGDGLAAAKGDDA
jgi:hypothetical protein